MKNKTILFWLFVCICGLILSSCSRNEQDCNQNPLLECYGASGGEGSSVSTSSGTGGSTTTSTTGVGGSMGTTGSGGSPSTSSATGGSGGCHPGFSDCNNDPADGCETSKPSCAIVWDVCVDHDKDTVPTGLYAGLTTHIGSRVEPHLPPMPDCLSPEPSSSTDATVADVCCSFEGNPGENLFIVTDDREADGTPVYAACDVGNVLVPICKAQRVRVWGDDQLVANTSNLDSPTPFTYDGVGTTKRVQLVLTLPTP